MPDENTMVWDVEGGGGTTVHEQGGDVMQAVDKTDPLPGLWSINYHRFDDIVQTTYAWD